MTSIAPNRKNGSGFSLLLNPQYFAVVFSHLMTDLYVGQRSIFLAFISAALGMSNTMLGLVTTLAVVSAGLSQPLFGYVADRIGARRMITIALIWTVGMFTLSILLPLSWAPVMLILANIGAGMYHPAGTTQAIRIGRILLTGRETTALSFFFLFGQTGFFLGPLIGGFLLNLGGEHALLALSVIGLPAIIFASRALRQLPVPDGLPGG
jgi:FSR family fosmidomycin resistance protein-like MFS transporter